MNRTNRILILIIPLLGGLIPLLIYWFVKGDLGTPDFTEFKGMSSFQQLAQIVAGLMIKPTYMLLSLALIIGLLGQTAGEIVSMLWGLSAFLIGEIFCGFNFVVFQHTSLLSEYIHSYGMVLAFGLIAYAFLEIFDRRLLHINDGRCTASELCGVCKRTSPLKCAARRTSQLIVALMALVSFIPLSAAVTPENYLTDVFGFSYSYARLAFYQWYELRALPLLALAFFIASWIPLLQRGGGPIPRLAKILFSAGIGALGFSLLRLTLASVFAKDLVWFEFWEEATELMFITAIGFILWQFRNTLLEKTPILDAVLDYIN
jgi:hypothetical protein